jgi:hypothetical protein
MPGGGQAVGFLFREETIEVTTAEHGCGRI